jgi:hypothetical protein
MGDDPELCHGVPVRIVTALNSDSGTAALIGQRPVLHWRLHPSGASTAVRRAAVVQSPSLEEPRFRADARWGKTAEMWVYEPDEVPKRKHHWKEPRAGFVMVGNVWIGKCPSTMTLESAEELLNSGIEWSPKGWRSEYPQRIYVVSDGVLYRAMPTNPGRSYHGFPEHHSLFPAGNLSLRQKIIELAKERNCESELRRWMRW